MQQRNFVVSASSRTPANTNGDGVELVSLKTFLESLVGDGEEIIVNKCKLIMDFFQTNVSGGSQEPDTSVVQPALIVSDAAIATATAASATTNLDEIFDAMTAGEFEIRLLCEPQQLRSRNVSHDGATYSFLKTAHITVDITNPIRKVAKRLIKSPVLATNPYTKIVFALKQDTAHEIHYGITMVLDYLVRPRVARMI
jgi:hypothetical protein